MDASPGRLKAKTSASSVGTRFANRYGGLFGNPKERAVEGLLKKASNPGESGMTIVFEAAVMPRDLRALLEFDARVFRKPDRFDAAYWRICTSHWMVVDGVRAGCCAFETLPGRLYISTSGLLPQYQGRGLGEVMKRWQIDYARRNGFERVVTNTRKSNTRMIDLNHKFGFRITRIEPGYYARPREATVVMELDLK